MSTLDYFRENTRWVIALGLTFVVIILLSINLYLTWFFVQSLNVNHSTVVFMPDRRLTEIWLKVNSIEQFIRTTPLVECGDKNGRKD